MSDLVLSARSGLEDVLRPGRRGHPAEPPGVTIAPVGGLSLASLMAHKGKVDALRERMADRLGLALPLTPRRESAGPLSMTWAGPGKWLAASARETPAAFEQQLREACAGVASVTNQSDGRTIVRVSGSKAREALAKGVPIDLDPRVFTAGSAALTVVAHINVQFWQIDSAPTYEFAIFRSFAVSFCRWLIEASAEFGIAVLSTSE